MSIDRAFGYQSQETRALAAIDSTKYPDTNKDFEANIIRLNQFVDYIAQYIGVMQKGIDKNNQDAIGQLQGTISDVIVLLGGGELLYGINLGDLQYFLPAIGALLGFDTTTPFPINLFNAAEHFILGYVIPLDSFSTAIEGIIDGWAVALGIDQDWIDAINQLLDAISNLTMSFEDLLTSVEDMINIMGPFDQAFADLWHAVTTLLGGLGISELGNLLDPVFHGVAPWIKELALILDNLTAIIEAFAGGINDINGILNFSMLFTPFLDFLNGFLPAKAGDTKATWDYITGWKTLITNAILPHNLLAGLVPDASQSAGLTGFIPLENLAMDLIAGAVGGAQSLIDAILAVFGYGPGTGTEDDVAQIFSNIYDFLGNPANFTTDVFNTIAAVENFITNMLHPTNLLAPLVSGTVPALNIPGLDASKIVSGLFSQSMIAGLSTSLASFLPINTWMLREIAGLNLVISPAFTDSTITRESYGPATVSYDTAHSHTGGQSMKIVSGGGTSGLYLLPHDVIGANARDPKTALRVQPSQRTFYLEGWLYNLAGNVAGGTTALMAFCQDSLGVNAPTTVTATSAAPPAAGAFTKMSGTLTVPTGYDLMWPVLQISGVPSGNSLWFDSAAVLDETSQQNIIDTVTTAMGIPGLGQTIDTMGTALQNIPGVNIATTLLASVIPGLDASKIVSGVLAALQIPNLDASKLTSGTLLASLIPGLDASKIISGVLSALQIPNLDASKLTSGTLLASLIPGLDASKIISGVFPQSMVNIISIAAGIVTGVLGAGQIPGLDASKITSGIFTVPQIPNLPAGQITSGTFLASLIPGLDASKITSGLFSQSQISGLVSSLAAKLGISDPLNAQNLFNQVPPALLGMIPYSHIGPGSPNLVSMPGFDTSGSIIGNPNWIYNATDGHTSLGCAQTTANGTLLTLVSNVINVTQGQQLTVGGWTKYTGLVATAGQNALRINVAGYLGNTPVTTQQVAGIASPAGTSGWVQMTGPWTVPAGIDNIVVQLVVTQAATAGTVLYDDATAFKSGLMSGNWMSGISGTVAADIQSAVDQIFQSTHGGSSTNNPLTSILPSLLNIPGPNIVTSLLASVIPGLDASKILTGVMGTARIPNITIPMSTDLGTLNDSVVNALTGLLNIGPPYLAPSNTVTGTDVVQSTGAMNQLFNSVLNNTQNIQKMRSDSTGSTVSGTSVSIDFSNYPDGPLPSNFTTTYSGTGSSALGIKNGNAGWAPLNNDGNRSAITVYNVAPTNTDFQIVRGSMASAPGGATSGGQPRIAAIGRVDNPANPRNFIWARAYCTGFLTYKADIGCTVNGVDTVFVSGIALTWSMDISVVIGAVGNPRRYQAFSGTQLVYDYTEAGTTSQLGPGFRYWGAKTEMKTGSGGAGNPGTIASTSVSDNQPPSVLGSTFRASRHSTGTVAYSNSGAGAPVKVGAGFFDTLDWISPDMSWDGTNLTVNTEGTYLCALRLNASNIPTNSKFTPCIFQNNVSEAFVGGAFADSWTGQAPGGAGEAALVYVHVGDVFAAGTAASAAGTITGDSAGISSYFEMALVNRSMA